MTTQSLVEIVSANPVLVLTDKEKFDRFYDEMKRETDGMAVDLTTEAGRKRVASMAYKVARTKTAIDEAGKLLTEEWRGKIKVVDEARKSIRDRLDALKDEVRAPLTKWEADEETRLAKVEAILDDLRSAALITVDDSADDVEGYLADLTAMILNEDVLQGHFDIAVKLREHATVALGAGLTRLRQEEADRAELVRLRKAEAERQEQIETDRLAKIEAERLAAERKNMEDEAERQRLAKIADDEARKEALERAAETAKAAAEEAAEKAAQAVLAAKEKAHAEALAAEKRRADEAEAAHNAQVEKIAQQRLAEEAKAKRDADEQAARDKDRKHRGAVMGLAKQAMMDLGAEEDVAKKIVLAIVAGEIPAVTLRF